MDWSKTHEEKEQKQNLQASKTYKCKRLDVTVIRYLLACSNVFSSVGICKSNLKI